MYSEAINILLNSLADMVRANTYCLSYDRQDLSSLIILTHVIHTNTLPGIF